MTDSDEGPSGVRFPASPRARRWLAVAVAVGLLGAGVAAVAAGSRGWSVLPDVTGESSESPYGWVLVLGGMAALLLAPLALAGVSGGRRWTMMGLAGLVVGSMAAAACAVALDSVATSAVLVGVAAVLALKWDRPRQLVLRGVLLAGVLAAALVLGPPVVVAAPFAAVVAVGLADELGRQPA